MSDYGHDCIGVGHEDLYAEVSNPCVIAPTYIVHDQQSQFVQQELTPPQSRTSKQERKHSCQHKPVVIKDPDTKEDVTFDVLLGSDSHSKTAPESE